MIPGIPNEFLLVVAAIIAVVIIGVLLSKRYERARDAGFQQAGRHLGWDGDSEAASPPAGVEGHPLFSRGHDRRTTNVFRGKSGQLDAAFFDYRFTTGGGKHSHTQRQTVMVFDLPNATLPDFQLRPENVFYKIVSAMGYQDIDLDNLPEFSKAYLLRGTDEAEIRRVFQSEVAHHFERHPGWCVEAGGSWVVVYRAGKRVKPGDLRDFIDDCGQIAAVMARG